MQIWDAWDGPRAFYHDVVEEDETLSKSLLFNAFIFMQVFNEINSRKILDEYNIFAGIHKSPIFLGVLALTAVLQVIIVQTPVSKIFHVHPLNGARARAAWWSLPAVAHSRCHRVWATPVTAGMFQRSCSSL